MNDATTAQPGSADVPMRLLHVLDDRGDEACGLTLAWLKQNLEQQATEGWATHLLLLGGAALSEAARAAGIDSFDRVTPPLGRPWLAPTVLHHAFGDEACGGPIAGVEVWSQGALGTAAIFRPQTPRRLHVGQPPTTAQRRRLSKLMMRAGFDVRVLTASLRRTLIDSGLPPGRVFHEPATLKHPAFQNATNKRIVYAPGQHRPRVIALLGNPAWRVDSANAALAVSMSQEITQRPLRMLVHPDADERPRAQRLLDDLRCSDMLIQDAKADTPWDLLGGVDAVMLGDRPAPMVTPMVLKAGVPLLVPDTPAHRELVESSLHDDADPAPGRVFWTPDGRPRHLAHAITRWVRHEDPTVRPPRATVGKPLAI